MKFITIIFRLTFPTAIAACSCNGQTVSMKDQTQSNPLLCDTVTGVCEIPAENTDTQIADSSVAVEKPIKILYFTDPICSSCWGIEPQLGRLKMEYGNFIEIDYCMGGLLPSWDVYNAGGISKPSDVYQHWEEVSAYYGMPMIGDVWIKDPLSSSYPPSIAFKAAQMQDKEKAVTFLRRLRECVFIESKNITLWKHIAEAAAFAGLDVPRLELDYNGPAHHAFEQDLQLARQSGVRGFPTLFVLDEEGNRRTIYGFRPYADFENAVKIMLPTAEKTAMSSEVIDYFSSHKSLTEKELSAFRNISIEQANRDLTELNRAGTMTCIETRHGNLWRLND